jgi:hypothetical protein
MSNNLPQISVEQALSRIEGQPEHPVLVEYIETLKKRSEVVNLGTNEAFAMRDKNGEIRAFKQNLRLSAANDGLVQPVWKGPFTISAQGYEMWAEAKGASVIFPKEVIIGSEWRPNPYIKFDGEGHRPQLIYARAVAFCYSSKGLPQVVDWTTIYDVPAYRLIDLLAKAKDAKAAFKLLPKNMQPEANNNEAWASYYFDDSTRFWINTNHDEAIKWYKSIINREKKAIDFAQTFARRNALKHLSGLQKPPGQDKNHVIDCWDIPVISWRPTGGNIIKWDAAQYTQLQANVVKMIEGDTEGFEADVTKGAEQVEHDEVDAVVAADPAEQAEDDAIDIQPTAVTRTAEPVQGEAIAAAEPDGGWDDHDAHMKARENFINTQKKPVKSKLSAEDQKVFDNLEITRQDWQDEWAKAMERLGLDPNTPTISLIDRGSEIFKVVNQIVDEEA